MKKNIKKIFISLVTTLGISVSAVGCKVSLDKTIPVYYGLLSSKEVTSTTTYEDDILNRYSALSDTLVDNTISSYTNGNMVPQGLTIKDNYILTSCYDSTSSCNSIVVTFNKETGKLVNICELDNKAHVGGISYDPDHNLVWISGEKGEINGYNAEKIISEYKIIPKYAHLDIGNGLKNYRNPFLNSVANLTVYNNTLYVGSFQTKDNGKVKIYSINEDSTSITLKYKGSFEIPSQVQGMAFYNNGENTYLILSRSYGKHMSSIIQIFKYDENITDYTDNIPYIYYKAPSMLEQISEDENKLYSIYESSAKKYEGAKDQIDKLQIYDLPSLIKKP